jgi:hypothetical protein
MKKAPTWFESLSNLLFSKRDLDKLNKNTNYNLLGRIVQEGLIPAQSEFMNKRKIDEESTRIAALVRVKINIADMLTGIILNIRSAGHTTSAWVYNMSRLISNARITRIGFELMSKYGLSTSYSLFIDKLKQGAIQKFYYNSTSELHKILSMRGIVEKLPTISYDNYVNIMYSPE